MLVKEGSLLFSTREFVQRLEAIWQREDGKIQVDNILKVIVTNNSAAGRFYGALYDYLKENANNTVTLGILEVLNNIFNVNEGNEELNGIINRENILKNHQKKKSWVKFHGIINTQYNLKQHLKNPVYTDIDLVFH